VCFTRASARLSFFICILKAVLSASTLCEAWRKLWRLMPRCYKNTNKPDYEDFSWHINKCGHQNVTHYQEVLQRACIGGHRSSGVCLLSSSFSTLHVVLPELICHLKFAITSMYKNNSNTETHLTHTRNLKFWTYDLLKVIKVFCTLQLAY
jgi:hypothetical protein